MGREYDPWRIRAQRTALMTDSRGALLLALLPHKRPIPIARIKLKEQGQDTTVLHYEVEVQIGGKLAQLPPDRLHRQKAYRRAFRKARGNGPAPRGNGRT